MYPVSMEQQKGHENRQAEGFRSRSIIGVPVAQVTYQEMLNWIGQQVRRPLPAETRVVVLANVHVLTEAYLDPGYMRVLWDADLVAPDGMPLRWAGQLLGSPLPDRCYGPELFQRALDAGQAHGWRHYLYGATDDTLELMRQTIQRRWPEARVVGAASPPFGPLDDQAELANISRINSAGADLVWVGMGCPKQERWMNRYRKHLEAHVALGVGAGFDFLAGTKAQAPEWMQQHGLEWIHRLGSEPGRLWKRYLVRNPLFMLLLSRQLLSGKER